MSGYRKDRDWFRITLVAVVVIIALCIAANTAYHIVTGR